MAGQSVDPRDLVDAADIAERAGLAHPNTVHNWRSRYPEFPAPVFERERVLLWSWPAVAAWLRATGRLPAAGEEE